MSEATQDGKLWVRRLWIAGGLGLLYALVLLNERFPTLRLGSDRADAIVFAVAQVVPTLLFIYAVTIGPWWARLISGLLVLPLVAVSLLAFALACFGAMFTSDGVDHGFEHIRTVVVDDRPLRVYRTNGGATTAYGVVVRQVCPVLPGLLLVQQLFSTYRASDVAITKIAPGRVRISGGQEDDLDHYALKVRDLALSAWSCEGGRLHW